MQTLPRLIAIYFVTALCLLLTDSIGYCELAPGSYEELKKEAVEVLKVEILNVQTNLLDEKVIFTAKVIEVKRSKTQLKKGQDIRIHSYHFTTPRKGAANPPLLAKGWSGIVYLNKGTGHPGDEDKKNDYCIAAYGHSFEKDEQ